jgi:hypothetical protein
MCCFDPEHDDGVRLTPQTIDGAPKLVRAPAHEGIDPQGKGESGESVIFDPIVGWGGVERQGMIVGPFQSIREATHKLLALYRARFSGQ